MTQTFLSLSKTFTKTTQFPISFVGDFEGVYYAVDIDGFDEDKNLTVRAHVTGQKPQTGILAHDNKNGAYIILTDTKKIGLTMFIDHDKVTINGIAPNVHQPK